MQFHHIGYLVKNIHNSLQAFQALGYEIEKETGHDEIRQAEIAFLQKEGMRIELIQPSGKESPLYSLMKHYKNNPYHLCYASSDMEKDIKELEKKGFMIFKEKEPAPCMGGRNVVFMVNADIGMVELCEDGKDLVRV